MQPTSLLYRRSTYYRGSGKSLYHPLNPSKPHIDNPQKIVEKSGDLWSLVEIPGNCRKYHKSVQDQTHFPRVSPKGPPRDPLRAYAGDFLGFSWISLGNLRRYIFWISLEVRGSPGSCGGSPIIWDFLGISWFGPVSGGAPLGFSWSLPGGLSGMVLDSLGSPEKDYKKIRKDFYIQKRFLILTLYNGYKRFLKFDSYFQKSFFITL